jgi:hypothetical protein
LEVASVNRGAKDEALRFIPAPSLSRGDLDEVVSSLKEAGLPVFVMENAKEPDPIPSPTRMVDKQLWQALKNGQLITFLIFDGEPVTGYLAGMDDETYFVLEPRKNQLFKKVIIQKHGTPQFEIHPDQTYNEGIPYYEEMERIIAPFRTYVLHNHLGQQGKNTSRYARTSAR